MFEESKVGTFGIAIGITAVGVALASFTLMSRFRVRFPRMARLAGTSYFGRAVFIYLCFTGGRSVETWLVENVVKREQYKEYLRRQDYFEKLKGRRIAMMGLPERLQILFNLK
jgi:hypothetical protein